MNNEQPKIDEREVLENCDEDSTLSVRVEPVMQLKNVRKAFTKPNGEQLVIVEDLCLEIKDIIGKPQILSILGKSGSGKTTLLRMIAGLDTPDAGEVLVSNGSRKNHQMRPVVAGDVGVVFQKYPLFDFYTVFENLVEPAVKSGILRKDAEQLANMYLTEFNMFDAAGNYPVECSGGMRQRVAILQQLMVKNRKFIVLDEPFSGLDVKNAAAVIKMLHRTAFLHTLNTFVIVTHDITNAMIISDTVVILDKAGIVKTFNLAEEGLAYHKNISELPRFEAIRHEIRGLMQE
jgi:NitT/TauT family transport system ATP-binding protein